MEIIDNKCPSCGASLEYNIETQNWKCKHCRKEYELSEVKKIKHSSRKNINELVCPTCNAKLIVNDNIISTKCIYCRNDVIVEKTKDKICVPDKIIPFRIGKKDIKRILKEYTKDKKLLPDTFDITKYANDAQGIYIPFWLFTNKYKVTARSGGKIVKKAELTFDHIPYDANKHLDNNLTKSIEPYNYKDLTNFEASYLAGFIAQKYDIESQECRKEIKERCAMSIEELLSNPKSKHAVNNDLVHETLIDEKVEYALLPLWLLDIEYNNDNYQIVINGQTGKITGQLPISKNKKMLLFTTVFIITLIIITLIFIVLRWGGLV